MAQVMDSSESKRPGESPTGAPAGGDNAQPAAQASKTGAEAKVKEPKRGRETDQATSSKRQKQKDDQDTEPKDRTVRPTRVKRPKKPKAEPEKLKADPSGEVVATEEGEATPKKKKARRKAKRQSEGATQETDESEPPQ